MTQNNRTERPVQILDKCIDCSDCVEGCPENCISKVEGEKTLIFDWTICVGCGICSTISCPAEAIEMVPEPEDK